MKRKKVIIIEDSFDDFKVVRNYLDSFCDCYPDVSDDDLSEFEKFTSLFQRCLNSGEKQIIKNEKKEELISQLNSYGDEIYFIIDYALKQNDTENITGIKFFETITNELYPDRYIPTLMLTGIDFDINVLNTINNELSKFKDTINKAADHKVFEYYRKDFRSSNFKQDIIAFIKNSKSYPRQNSKQTNSKTNEVNQKKYDFDA